jgi:hypothetical protein
MLMNKAETKEKMVTVPESGLIALVASKLKGVPLFPERLEEAKEYFKNAKMKTGYQIPSKDTFRGLFNFECL